MAYFMRDTAGRPESIKRVDLIIDFRMDSCEKLQFGGRMGDPHPSHTVTGSARRFQRVDIIIVF
jgi:hypothetical protein